MTTGEARTLRAERDALAEDEQSAQEDLDRLRAAPLDVDRLARAIDETGTVTWDDDPRVLRPKTPTEIARDAAPRYAALGDQAAEEGR